MYSPDVNRSGIYQILKRFRRKGLVEVRAKDGKTYIYSVRADGREALREFYEWTDERVLEG